MPYDPQMSLLAIFLHWRGTVWPLVLQKSMFWVLMGMHVCLLIANEYYVTLPSMDVSIVIGLPASLLIFLTVFYNGNCCAPRGQGAKDRAAACAQPPSLSKVHRIAYVWQTTATLSFGRTRASSRRL